MQMVAANQRGFQHRQAQHQARLDCVGHPSQISDVTASSVTEHIWGLKAAQNTVCTVAVKVWDARGCESDWSDGHTFATLPSQLNASWISEHGAKEDTSTTLLRNKFTASQRPSSAVVSLSGLGHYELTINGVRVGDHMMDPGWTKYCVHLLGSCCCCLPLPHSHL